MAKSCEGFHIRTFSYQTFNSQAAKVAYSDVVQNGVETHSLAMIMLLVRESISLFVLLR